MPPSIDWTCMLTQKKVITFHWNTQWTTTTKQSQCLLPPLTALCHLTSSACAQRQEAKIVVGDYLQILVQLLPSELHTHTHSCTHTQTCTHTHKHIYTHRHTRTHTHTNTYTHAHTQKHAHTNTHTLTNTYTHKHIYTHIRTHTYMCTHTHTQATSIPVLSIPVYWFGRK